LGDALIGVKMAAHGRADRVDVTALERVDEFCVDMSTAGVLVRMVVQPAEPDPDVALGGPPQHAQDVEIPGRRGRSKHVEVEFVVAFVHAIKAAALVTDEAHQAAQLLDVG
jgi:hypothetical protein